MIEVQRVNMDDERKQLKEAIENADDGGVSFFHSKTPVVKRIRKDKHTQVLKRLLKSQRLLKRHNCEVCGKNYANSYNLSRHRCDNGKQSTSIVLKWNGKCWKSVNRNIHYQLNLGRDLLSLVEKGAIKEDALNSSQKEYIQMYKNLFIDL